MDVRNVIPHNNQPETELKTKKHNVDHEKVAFWRKPGK